MYRPWSCVEQSTGYCCCRRRLEEFVESEAELSGSDHGMPSDEERAYLDSEDDEMLEGMSGDSDINMSEDELKKQVNRVHM